MTKVDVKKLTRDEMIEAIVKHYEVLPEEVQHFSDAQIEFIANLAINGPVQLSEISPADRLKIEAHAEVLARRIDKGIHKPIHTIKRRTYN